MQSGYDITLTVIVSVPPGTGSVEYMSGGFRIFGGQSYGVEYLQSDDLGDGMEILQQMTEDLMNCGFQMVDFGPFWFQRRFEREYIPGDIDDSDKTPR
jgi:hypothetical protein